MAKKFLDLKNTKTRALVLLGAILIIAIIMIIYFTTKKTNVLQGEESHTAKPPEIESVPGGVTSEKYRKLQEEENKRRAEAAIKSGTSAVATIIGAEGSGGIAGKETFGIEDQLLKTGGCNCPQPGAECEYFNPVIAQKLVTDIQADNNKALALINQNPCLPKAICKQNFELALKLALADKALAKIFLNECPEMAKALAEKNPAYFKQLMLENPELAKKLADKNPELFKKLMEDDPAFARALAKSNPDLVKNLMKNDPAFAKKMMEQNPDMVKELMSNDPAFADAMMKSNPDMVKKMMLDDPAFARALAKNNPDMVKKMMMDDPAFARALAKSNPELVKELMKNDPDFARAMLAQNPDMVQELMKNDPEFAKTMNAYVPPKEEVAVTAGAPKEVVVKRKPRVVEAPKVAQLTELQSKQMQNLLTAMDAQSKAALQSWNEVNPQQFVAGEWASKEKIEEEKRKRAGPIIEGVPGGPPGAVVAVAPPNIKAGTVMFAVLDTSVNSDEPGPVLATIVSGKYKGAKLLGTFTTTTIPGMDSPEHVALNFNLFNIPEAPASVSVQAVAIDPDTARTALATNVDRHYLLRYGGLFASALMTGYAKVLTSQGTTQITATNGQSVTTQSPTLSSRDKLYAALGQVGQQWGQAIQNVVNRPYTVTLDAGTGLGILFLADVSLTGKP